MARALPDRTLSPAQRYLLQNPWCFGFIQLFPNTGKTLGSGTREHAEVNDCNDWYLQSPI